MPPLYTPSPRRFLTPATKPHSTSSAQKKRLTLAGTVGNVDNVGLDGRKRFLFQGAGVGAKLEIGTKNGHGESRGLMSEAAKAQTRNAECMAVLKEAQNDTKEVLVEEAEDEDENEVLFTEEEPFKRRRVSPPPSSPPHFDQETIKTPTHHPYTVQHQQQLRHVQTPSRFMLQPKPSTTNSLASNSSCTTITTPFTNRPHFILPRPNPSAPTTSSTSFTNPSNTNTSPSRSLANPLPDTFSPRRKSGTFLPQGLASTLQSWVLEAAESSYAAQNTGRMRRGRDDREDGVKFRVRVGSVGSGRQGKFRIETDQTEIRGEEGFPQQAISHMHSTTFLCGTTNASLYNFSRLLHPGPPSHAPSSPSLSTPRSRAAASRPQTADVHVLLAGQGGRRDKGDAQVMKGDVVGIKAPFWEIVVGEGRQQGDEWDQGKRRENRWVVGVEWVVLGSEGLLS